MEWTVFKHAQSVILQSWDFNLCVQSMLKLPIHGANKTDPWPYFFSAKNYSTPKVECMCEMFKKTVEWNFSNLEIVFFSVKQNLLLNFFLIFPVFFIKKYGVTGLVSKIYATGGKKWVKFVVIH